MTNDEFRIRGSAAVWRRWLVALLLPFQLGAHDSPEHIVDQLTQRMKARGVTPELLWQRAAEYRALGQPKPAAADLERALKLRADFLPAYPDLAQVQLARHQTTRALATVERALKLIPAEQGRAPLYMMRAEVHAARERFDLALADCDRAFAAVPTPDLDWYLTRGQFQMHLRRFAEAAAGFQQGFEATGSVVLEAEWIEALIDLGKGREALDRIEPHLAASRRQSAWLLRRARARLSLAEFTTARGDLHAAITEINGRLNPAKPDHGLLLDRGLAYALLGDEALAKKDWQAARKAGAGGWPLWRLEAAMNQAEKIRTQRK